MCLILAINSLTKKLMSFIDFAYSTISEVKTLLGESSTRETLKPIAHLYSVYWCCVCLEVNDELVRWRSELDVKFIIGYIHDSHSCNAGQYHSHVCQPSILLSKVCHCFVFLLIWGLLMSFLGLWSSVEVGECFTRLVGPASSSTSSSLILSSSNA